MKLIDGRNTFSHTRWLGVWVFLFLTFPQTGWSASTPAGTMITNVATVSYTIGSPATPTTTSAAATFQVDELIQPVLTWQNAAAVTVNTPGSNDALTFLLTNSGNGQEKFSLARTNGPLPLPVGNYTPLNGTLGSLYFESGLQTGFQATGPNADTPYVTGANDPDLAPGTGLTIYLISDTPVVANNAQGEVQLSATSLTAGAAGAVPGTSFAGLGQGGVFAVVGSTNARASATGRYIASGLTLVVNKTVLNTIDPIGGSVVMPGSITTYQIAVVLTDTGTATNLMIADPLPVNTTFVQDSISVDGVAKTDAADADNAQFSANTVSVSLGNVAAPANIVITFRATIN